MLCRPGHTSAPAGPTPPAGPCVWRLLKLRCAPATVRLCVTHIRTVAGLLLGAQLGIVTAAAPSSTASTVAILAQGTKWADALPQAFFFKRQHGVAVGIASASAAASVSAMALALALALALRRPRPRPRCRRRRRRRCRRWRWRWRCVARGGVAWRGVAWRGGVAGHTDKNRYHT
jgi:hypothetical protein